MAQNNKKPFGPNLFKFRQVKHHCQCTGILYAGREAAEMRMRTIAAADLTVTRLRRVLQALRASLPMPVGPAAIQALAMSLHELVTNAAKYGALSKPDGQVAVSWDNRSNGDAAASLVLVWQERGGPPAAAKVSPDYGTSLIRDLIPYELGGAVDLAFAPDGVNCRIELPLERI